MRKAAGIILVALGVWFLLGLIVLGVVFGISIFLAPFGPMTVQGIIMGVHVIVVVVSAAFHITGGILCLRRKCWRVCLASASFAVLYWVFYSGGSLFGRGAWLLSGNILVSVITWVMLVAAVIAVIFIVRTKKEWQDILD